jgi:hypothetical protein
MSTTVTGSPPRGQAAPRSHAVPGGLQAATGLEVGIAVRALVMAIGCAWGLTRRLSEYR